MSLHWIPASTGHKLPRRMIIGPRRSDKRIRKVWSMSMTQQRFYFYSPLQKPCGICSACDYCSHKKSGRETKIKASIIISATINNTDTAKSTASIIVNFQTTTLMVLYYPYEHNQLQYILKMYSIFQCTKPTRIHCQTREIPGCQLELSILIPQWLNLLERTATYCTCIVWKMTT